jgi:hypothetical protein
MKYRKVGFRVILLFNRVKGIKIINRGNILIVFIKLINLIIPRQPHYLTYIGIIGFPDRKIFR